MLIETVFTFALYCPSCGKTTLHQISQFDRKGNKNQMLTCSCGQVQAEVKGIMRGQCLLYIPCPLCQTSHVICIENKSAEIKKLYCTYDNLELGFAGGPDEVANVIAKHKYGLQLFEQDTSIKNPQIIMEMLNRLHDIAENNGLRCGCRSVDIEVKLLDDGIELLCLNCGEQLRFYARGEDLRYLKSIDHLELMCRRYSQRK